MAENNGEGRFELVNPRMIIVDHRYQRELRRGRAVKIAQSFDWRQFGVLNVSLRENGMYYTYDGQHRLEAALLRDFREVPCMVFEGLTENDEAELFVRLQRDRANVAPYERFKAALFAGDPIIKRINEIVLANGWEVGGTPGKRRISAVQVLVRLYNRYGEEGLKKTFFVIKGIWDGEEMSLHGPFVEGLGTYYGENEGVTPSSTLKKLEHHLPKEIMRTADGLRLDVGGSKAENVTRVVKKIVATKRPGQ